MGSMSVWHWLILAVVVMLLFGKGKISEMMGDAAKGIKAFKKGMSEEEEAAKAVEAKAAEAVKPVETPSATKV